MESTLKLTIPLDVLTSALRELPLEQKQQLAEWLEALIAQSEEEAWEVSPKFQAELNEARAQYKAGDFLSLEEYSAQQAKTE